MTSFTSKLYPLRSCRSAGLRCCKAFHVVSNELLRPSRAKWATRNSVSKALVSLTTFNESTTLGLGRTYENVPYSTETVTEMELLSETHPTLPHRLSVSGLEETNDDEDSKASDRKTDDEEVMPFALVNMTVACHHYKGTCIRFVDYVDDVPIKVSHLEANKQVETIDSKKKPSLKERRKLRKMKKDRSGAEA